MTDTELSVKNTTAYLSRLLNSVESEESLFVATEKYAAESVSVERAAILRSEAEISAFERIAEPWIESRSSVSNPKMFLASVDPRLWWPLVVTVSRGSRIIGLALFKERKLAGIPTGILYGDATLNAMTLSSERDAPEVFRSAIRTVLEQRGVRALRLLVPPDSPELDTLREMSALYRADLTCFASEYHFSLPLGGSYSSFLAGMGKNTRHNLRRYKQRFDESGHRYVPLMNFRQFSDAAFELLGKSVIRSERKRVDRCLRIFSAAKHPLLAGLQNRDGRWMSIIGGWYDADSATVFFQMNDDREHASSHLSLVMRAYLIETLIGAGLRTLRFWAGVSYPLRNYCVPVPTMKAFLDKRGLLWSSIRGAVGRVAPILPQEMKWPMADWIHGAGNHA